MKGFSQSLRDCRRAGLAPVIPDFKLASPEHGPLFSGRDPVAAARELAAAGAPALSVVTEGQNFGGSPALLEQIAGAVDLPVLRKDFLTTPQEIRQTARLGAAAVLLICACLEPGTLRALYDAALEAGLEPLVEAHSPQQLALAAQLGAKLVGINNRDILALERDGGGVETTQRLAAAKPAGALLVSESGLNGPGDVAAALAAGADAALVGTAIWKAPHPVAFYRSLLAAGGCGDGHPV